MISGRINNITLVTLRVVRDSFTYSGGVSFVLNKSGKEIIRYNTIEKALKMFNNIVDKKYRIK